MQTPASTATTPTDKPPYRGCFYCLVNVCKLLSLIGHVTSLLLHEHNSSPASRPGLLLCLAWLMLAAAVSIFKNRTQASWTAQQRADSALAMQITFPVISNILGQLYLPTFEQSRVSWPGFLVLSIFEGTLLLDLPPAHALLQSAVLIPAVIYLDLVKAGFADAGGRTCSTQLLWRGLLILLLGVVTTLLTGMLYSQAGRQLQDGDPNDAMKTADAPSVHDGGSPSYKDDFQRQARTASGASCIACMSQPPDLQPPLTALGITLPCWLCTALQQYEVALLSLASRVDTAAVLRTICLPMCMYFAARVTLSRWGLKAACVSSMSHEEWLLSMVAWYMLGRDSCHMGVAQGMQQVVLQLRAAQSLLTDVLPAHAVKMLMARTLITSGPLSAPAGRGSLDNSNHGPRQIPLPDLFESVDREDQSGCAVYECWSNADSDDPDVKLVMTREYGRTCSFSRLSLPPAEHPEPEDEALEPEGQASEGEQLGQADDQDHLKITSPFDSPFKQALPDSYELRPLRSAAANACQLPTQDHVNQTIHTALSAPILLGDMCDPIPGYRHRKWDADNMCLLPSTKQSKLRLRLPASKGTNAVAGRARGRTAHRVTDHGLAVYALGQSHGLVEQLVSEELVSLTDADTDEDGSPLRGQLQTLPPRKRAQHLQRLLGAHLEVGEGSRRQGGRRGSRTQASDFLPLGVDLPHQPASLLHEQPAPIADQAQADPVREGSNAAVLVLGSIGQQLSAGLGAQLPPSSVPCTPLAYAEACCDGRKPAPVAAVPQTFAAAPRSDAPLGPRTPEPSAGTLPAVRLDASDQLPPLAPPPLRISPNLPRICPSSSSVQASPTSAPHKSPRQAKAFGCSSVQPNSPCHGGMPSTGEVTDNLAGAAGSSVLVLQGSNRPLPQRHRSVAALRLSEAASVRCASAPLERRAASCAPASPTSPGCGAGGAASSNQDPTQAAQVGMGASGPPQPPSGMMRTPRSISSTLVKLPSALRLQIIAAQGQQALPGSSRPSPTLGQLGSSLLRRISAADPFHLIPTTLSSPHAGASLAQTRDSSASGAPIPTAAAAGSSNQSLMATVGPAPIVVAASHPCVTLFFSDIVGFSTWAHKLPPEVVMGTLNDLYSRLDDIILNEMPSLYKVETIGDAYVMAANLLTPDPDHAATVMRFALRAQEEVSKVMRPDLDDGTPLQMRIGLHSGPIMSGIVGKIRQRFCLYGNTMNMAARTEATCPPGCIQVTAATRHLALSCMPEGADLVERGAVQVKGSDKPIHMYLLTTDTPSGFLTATSILASAP